MNLRGTSREFRRFISTCFLLWLVLTGFVIFLTFQKTKRLAKLDKFTDTRWTPSTVENLKKDVCFDPNELKCKIVQQQRDEIAWKKRYYSKRAADFDGPIEVDTSEDEKKCPHLYGVAREMLNGLKIKLPHETNHTQWKFRARLDLNKLKQTHLQWNYPWKQNNPKKTENLLRHYNVSARTIKQRKILLSYGHNCCNASKLRAIDSAIRHAKMDYAESLDLSALSVPFQISHSEQLRMRKGAGYWLWKAYIILQALLYKLKDGDLLVYHDSGMYFVNDIGPLLKICQDVKPSILAFAMPYEERMYSKRDAFILIDMDHPIVYAKGQTQRLANLIVAMKNCETIQYFMEYLAYTMDFRIYSDKENVLGKPNFKDFVGNRHDQTVHSLLSKKWGILELRDPCTCGRGRMDTKGGYASGPYTGLYVHDRKRS